MLLNVQGKIVVLYGGPSTESAVSKMSAEGVFSALSKLHENTVLLEYTQNWVTDILSLKPAFVFNAMHGCPGEDGKVQAVLDELDIPYQGSGFEASVKAMDKHISKYIFVKEGIDTPKGVLIVRGSLCETLPFYPAFVKPNLGGSSVDASMVENETQWQEIKQKINLNEDFLAEEYITGRELTVAVMGNRALGVMEMRPKGHAFFDYTAKYTTGQTDYIYPAPIATEVYNKAEQIAIKAHKALGCEGVSRVDFILSDKENRLVTLEVNTLPGMTATSLVPKMAKHHGMSYEDLITYMVNESLKGKSK